MVCKEILFSVEFKSVECGEWSVELLPDSTMFVILSKRSASKDLRSE